MAHVNIRCKEKIIDDMIASNAFNTLHMHIHSVTETIQPGQDFAMGTYTIKIKMKICVSVNKSYI